LVKENTTHFHYKYELVNVDKELFAIYYESQTKTLKAFCRQNLVLVNSKIGRSLNCFTELK